MTTRTMLLMPLACAAAFRVGPPVGPLPLHLSAQGHAGKPLANNHMAMPLAIALLAVAEPASAADTSWIAPTKFVLGPLLSLGTIAFLLRVVLSWFPTYKLDEPPWNVIAIPTEPFLKPTRQLIPPVAGVDISPIIWVSFLSFLSEILLGPQGLLTIIQRKGGM